MNDKKNNAKGSSFCLILGLPFVAALAVATCRADDFSKFSDLDFAERYAFSTNRAALVSELKRGSGQWYFYSLLNLQNERRPDEESKFLNSNPRSGLSDDAWRRLQLRHMFLAWEANPGGNAGRTTDEFLAWDLKMFLGIEPPVYVHEVEAAPNTYPSALDQKDVSFDAFLKAGFEVQTCFRDEFRFLAYSGWVETPTHSDYFNSWTEALPGTPGHFEAVRKRIGSRKAYERDKGYEALTLSELDALVEQYGNEKWRVPLLENRDFIAAYRKRLAAGTDGLHAEHSGDERLGWIYIGGGSFAIRVGDDAIHAASAVQIDGGSFAIADAEGIEGTYIQINGGELDIRAGDDGLNAGRKSSAYRPTIESTGGRVTTTADSRHTPMITG